MFGKILIAAALLGTAPQPDTTEPFAVACTGKAKFTDSGPTQNSTRDYDLPKQIYVIDVQKKSVQRAMMPRQTFEDICFRGGYIDETEFSPGQIAVHSEKAGDTCDFRVNRASGDAEYYSEHELGTGGFVRIEFKMNCDRTDIPVFDPSRNRF